MAPGEEPMRASRRLLVLLIPLALIASACTVTIVPGERTTGDRPSAERPTPDPRPEPPRPQPPVVDLPDQGAIVQFEIMPNTIYPGSVLTFRTRVARDGFLSVSALAPDGRVVVLVRQAPVTAGFQLVPPVPSPPADRVLASAPTGWWLVRAQFSNQKTPVAYAGVRGEANWTRAIAEDLRGVPGAAVFEGSFEVRAR